MPPCAEASEHDENGDAQPPESPKTVVMFSGSTKWDVMGRKGLPVGVAQAGGSDAGACLLAPHVVPELDMQGIVKVVSGPVSCHVFAIAASGALYGWGRNECGQLGLEDLTRKNFPTVIDALTDFRVVDVALGRNHTILLTADSCVYTMGSNRAGQLGVGSMQPEQTSKPQKLDLHALKGSKPVGIGAGADFCMIVAEDGNVYSFGHPEYGQLGHGTDGEYIEGKSINYNYEMSPRRIDALCAKDVHITEVRCGVNHSAALDKEGKVWTWGMGGYGRLGHRVPHDQHVPKCIDRLEGVTAVYAGSKFCYAINKLRQTYFWGQTKSSGEATMYVIRNVWYPKPIHDLTGWNVRNIAGGQSSTMVAADASVISWGPSPCYGELGYGDKEVKAFGVVKSSTKPKLVDSLEGCHALNVAMGLSFSVIVVRCETEADRKIVTAHKTLDEATALGVGAEAEAEEDSEPKGKGGGKKRKASAGSGEEKSSSKSKASTRGRKRRR